MRIGTKSILFGVHQFMIHPWFVAEGWRRLYGFPYDPRLWLAFFLHDLGYIGKPNMDGAEGEQHPLLGAAVMRFLFGDTWGDLCLCHSRYLAKKNGLPYSRLCVADKLAISLTPAWLYLPMARATGEMREYMTGQDNRTPALGRSEAAWLRDVQEYCLAWVAEHKDCKADTWTGTEKDLAVDPGQGVDGCTCQPHEGLCNYCVGREWIAKGGDFDRADEAGQ